MKHKTRKPTTVNISADKLWPGAVERMRFNVSADRPLCVVRHNFPHRLSARFDMHYGLEFGILLKGSMRRYWQNNELTIKAGDVWFCGMWEPHGWEVVRAPCRALVLIIEPSFILRAGRELHAGINWLAPFRAPPARRPRIPSKLRATAMELADGFPAGETSEDVPEARNRLKMLELLLLPAQSAPPAPEYNADEELARVNKSVQMVFNARSYISTKDAARHCGMNRNAFATLFNGMMGISFSEFALRHRASSAARDMASCGTPVKRVAADWGFADPGHFCRCFRKYYQCAPSDWIRRR